MRGRLRVVDGDTVLWREVPIEYWHEMEQIIEDGTDLPMIEAPTLPHGTKLCR